eukprot:1160636-Pelagomonas_calceolata.AAC.8
MEDITVVVVAWEEGPMRALALCTTQQSSAVALPDIPAPATPPQSSMLLQLPLVWCARVRAWRSRCTMRV